MAKSLLWMFLVLTFILAFVALVDLQNFDLRQYEEMSVRFWTLVAVGYGTAVAFFATGVMMILSAK